MLQKLGSGKVTDPNVIQSELHRVVQGPQSVTVTMRVVHAAILAMMLFIPWMILSFASIIPVLIAIVDEQKDARSFTTLAAVLKDPVGHSGLIEQIGEVKRSEYLKPERIATIETIAKEQHEHFDKAYRHLGFLERGLMELMNRVRGREDFAAIPTPDFSKLEHVAERDASLNQSSNEKVKAKAPGIRISQGNNFKVAQIEDAPESVDSIILRLERLESERNAPAPVNWLGRLRDLIILPLCAIVVWGGIFRGGISHAITGLAVVRNDGRRGGILQCMWRSLLFWFPLLAIAGVILVVDAHGTDGVWWTQQLRRCFFVLPVLYLVAVIRWPSRGPHDLVSGTFVVPR